MSAVDFFSLCRRPAGGQPAAPDRLLRSWPASPTWASWPANRSTPAASAPSNAPRSTPGARRRCKTCMAALTTLGASVNGWTTFTETMGVYGNYYFKRAVVALVGLGCQPAPKTPSIRILTADADGNPVDRGQRLRHPFRRRQAAAGRRVLVGDDV